MLTWSLAWWTGPAPEPLPLVAPPSCPAPPAPCHPRQASRHRCDLVPLVILQTSRQLGAWLRPLSSHRQAGRQECDWVLHTVASHRLPHEHDCFGTPCCRQMKQRIWCFPCCQQAQQVVLPSCCLAAAALLWLPCKGARPARAGAALHALCTSTSHACMHEEGCSWLRRSGHPHSHANRTASQLPQHLMSILPCMCQQARSSTAAPVQPA